MPKNTETFSVAAIARIMKKAVPKQISKKAAIEIQYHITQYAKKRSEHIVTVTKHAGRSTVLEKDVKVTQ